MKRALLCAFPILASFALLGADPTPDPKLKAILALHWSVQPVHLSRANSTISPPKGIVVVQGADATKFDELTNGHGDDDMVAAAVNTHTFGVVFVDYSDVGYVTVDDWTSLDPGEMLSGIKKNTDDSNAERKRQRVPELFVDQWVQKPVYDEPTKTVRWAIAAHDSEGGNIVNSIALVLGRHGYEQFTWVTDRKAYVAHGGMLDAIVSAQRFDAGSRYQDHVDGDKLAGYGVAALVGSVAGAGLYKVGVFAALLLLLKKLWFIVAAMVYGSWRWLKGRFTSTKLGPPSANV